MIQFDEHIFHKWVVQPPTRQFFANFFFGVISRGLPWVFCLGSRWGHVFWKTKFRHAGTLADVEDGHWRGKGRKLQTYREFENTNWAKKKGILGYIGDEVLFPVFLEIIIHHCKDPVIKQPVWLMESIRLFLYVFVVVAQLFYDFQAFSRLMASFVWENSSFCGIFSGEKTQNVLQEQCCFYKAATVAFIFTGFICIAIWIPWAATTEAQGSIRSIHRDPVAVTDWWNPGGNLLYIGDERMKS